MGPTPDKIFDDHLLASIYDDFDSDRSDLIPYLNMTEEFGARDIADLGCGTGVLALMLADKGLSVTAIDPALGSIEVARGKPGAERVNWFHGYANLLPRASLDLVYMTGNTAQTILDNDEWRKTLQNINRSLKTGGHFVFETRKLSHEAWTEWNKQKSRTTMDIPGKGMVESWVDLLDVKLPYVSFRWTWLFHNSGETVSSDSTIRYRSLDEVTTDLSNAGFIVDDVREAPDRPGKEMVLVTRKPL